MNNVYKKVNGIYVNLNHSKSEAVCCVILDTGIFPHPDLKNRVCGFIDLVNGKVGMYDDNSHGTHVAGIIGGDGAMSRGKYKGIAPNSKMIMLKVLDKEGNGETDSVLKGVEWIRKNKDKYKIKVVNISVGTLPSTGNNEKSSLVDAVEILWDENITVVAAAGNGGPKPYTITTPGNSKKVITVGASDDMQGDSTGRVRTNYSGRGPTFDCVCKPDLVAPGMNIISCNAMNKIGSRPYSIKSGTSMSTPIVTGAIMLMNEKYTGISNLEIKKKIRETCTDMGLPKNKQGWGLLNIGKLLSD